MHKEYHDIFLASLFMANNRSGVVQSWAPFATRTQSMEGIIWLVLHSSGPPVSVRAWYSCNNHASLAWLESDATAEKVHRCGKGKQLRNNSIILQPFFQTDSVGTMRNLFYFLVLALSLVDGAIMQQQLRGGADRGPDADAGHRHLQTPDPLFPASYYSTQDPAVLGTPDTNATLGNPLKGLFGGTRWNPPPLLETVPFSLEWYNVAESIQCFANRSVCP